MHKYCYQYEAHFQPQCCIDHWCSGWYHGSLKEVAEYGADWMEALKFTSLILHDTLTQFTDDDKI